MGTDVATQDTFSAYGPDSCIGQGALTDVALAAHRFLRTHPDRSALILQDSTCQIIDLDLSGDEALLERKANHYPFRSLTPVAATNAPISQEITLLPRHWQWLSQQGDNASATLRRLIDDARRDPKQLADDACKHQQQLTYRFCQTLCGDFQGYEEALRALYAGDRDGFEAHTSTWPPDFASRARSIAEPVWASDSTD